MSDKEVDEISGTETTGHEWDGIKELNTPMPRWWLWTFYGCIVWAFGYAIVYPAVPLLNSATPGVLGYTSRGEYAAKAAEAKAEQAFYVEQIEAMDVTEITANEELARFARAGGKSVFKVYCSQCHGSGAQGASGYPNLNDDEWIWGGTPDAIYTTIAHGVRYEDDDETRFNEMPRFGADEILSTEEIVAVANYVGRISGGEADAGLASEGQALFAENCSACHAELGVGDADLGGPALNNGIWLYGDGSIDALVAQISDPAHGVMPAWNKKLGDAAVKQLAVYVHSLGGGQ
jgi:cytochrome c oxidase cbb3-type subunit 3